MALIGYIGAGTYSTIDRVFWDRKAKAVSIELTVHSDSTKTSVLASRGFELGCAVTFRELAGIAVNTPPESPVEGALLAVGSAPTGDFEGHAGVYAYHNAESGWHFSPMEHEVFYHAGSNAYYRFNGSAVAVVPGVFDSRTWDAFFAPALVAPSTAGSNVVKQSYLWLKTQPGFESVTDG